MILSKTYQQRELYDKRYATSKYDTRSAVSTLTIEQEALHTLIQKSIDALHPAELTLLDFGCGTGRVTNDFIINFQSTINLRVVMCDISAAGLLKSMSTLKSAGYTDRHISSDQGSGCIGILYKEWRGYTRTVVYILSDERMQFSAVGRKLIQANLGRRFCVTTSWHGAVSHLQSVSARRGAFKMLGDIANIRGSLILTAPTIGDLVPEFEHGYFEDIAPPTSQGRDVIYETELPGENNYAHLFGEDFIEYAQQVVTSKKQIIHTQAMRMPGFEFTSKEDEQINYRRTIDFNAIMAKRDNNWSADDLRKIHTIGVLRYYP